jgi:hypothetical protein
LFIAFCFLTLWFRDKTWVTPCPGGTSAWMADVMLVCIEAAIDGCVKLYGQTEAARLTVFCSLPKSGIILGRARVHERG